MMHARGNASCVVLIWLLNVARLNSEPLEPLFCSSLFRAVSARLIAKT